MEQCALCLVSNAIDFLIAGLNIFQLAPVWLHLAAKHTNTQNGKSNRYKFQSFRINFREDGNERETRVITSVTITYLEQLSKLMKLFCLGILNWQIDVISEVTIFHCNIYGNTREMTSPKHFGNVQFFLKSIWTFGRTKRKWTIFCKVFYIEYGTEPWYIHDINVSLVVLQEVVNRTCFVLLQSTYSITGNETIWKLCHLPMLMYVTFILIYADRICTWIYLLMHVSSDAMKMFSHRKKEREKRQNQPRQLFGIFKGWFCHLGNM